MLSELKPAILITILFTVLTGLLYPLAITGAAQLLFHKQANGSLIEKNGKVIGSALSVRILQSRNIFIQGRPPRATVTMPRTRADRIWGRRTPPWRIASQKMRRSFVKTTRTSLAPSPPMP
jgi:K+-transporting ATPase c subunit